MTVDAVFLVDLDPEQQSWGNISDREWFALVKVLEQFGIVSFGFQDVDEVSKLDDFLLVDRSQMVAVEPRLYEPFHSESKNTILSFSME